MKYMKNQHWFGKRNLKLPFFGSLSGVRKIIAGKTRFSIFAAGFGALFFFIFSILGHNPLWLYFVL